MHLAFFSFFFSWMNNVVLLVQNLCDTTYFAYLCDIMKMFWLCEQNLEHFIEPTSNILLSDIKNDVD